LSRDSHEELIVEKLSRAREQEKDRTCLKERKQKRPGKTNKEKGKLKGRQ
jgi:hypothetical protein